MGRSRRAGSVALGWGRVEIERIGFGYGGICGHGLAVERKRQGIGEGRSGIVKGKAIPVVMEVRYRESCRGKEMAENRRSQGPVW